MTIETQTVQLRKLTATEGMIITDKKTKTLRSSEVYLGKEENPDNFIEIDENTPLPEPKHIEGQGENEND